VAASLERDGLDVDGDRTRAVPSRQTPRQRAVGDPGGMGRLDLIRESAKSYSVTGKPPHRSAGVREVERHRRRKSEAVR